jgi:hypothetical protein
MESTVIKELEPHRTDEDGQSPAIFRNAQDTTTIVNDTRPAIRHAEKRRTSTCDFADRVAHAALQTYRATVDIPRPHPTCVAAILVYHDETQQLTVVALGVGTKFLPDALLRAEESTPVGNHNRHTYGRRVRDLHAEVLCRRAFRRYLSQRLCCKGENATASALPKEADFLERAPGSDWRMRQGYTLHAYFSSTPCGNATVKKFVTLSKEKFRPDLATWPTERHPPQPAHSVHLGQFALLLKKDASSVNQSITLEEVDTEQTSKRTKRISIPPQNIPPGTCTVDARQGSLHTCSDKVCRWNYLGWQGSLLASILESPLYMTSITVGRKYSGPCLRRAVCCRLSPDVDKDQNGQRRAKHSLSWTNHLRHPAIMCTAVYVEPDAVVMTQSNGNDDFQFTDSRAFVWWPGLTQAHVIDGTTGFALNNGEGDQEPGGTESPVCTKQLTEAFLSVQQQGWHDGGTTGSLADGAGGSSLMIPETLAELRALKRRVSPAYEAKKEQLFRHKVMEDWVRRSADVAVKGIIL